jgi:hypothetical protein
MILNHGRDAGPHTHADLLSFEAYAYGKPLALDAGIGTTYDDTLYVPWYKSSRAHSMVVLNGRNIDREGTTGDRIVWDTTSSLEYWAGSHGGYSKYGVGARRRVAFIRPSYWMIMDEMECQRGGDTLSWVFLTPEELTRTGRGVRSVSAPGVEVRCLEPVSGTTVEHVWAASPTDPDPGKTALVRRVALDRLTSPGRTVRFPVLLYPFRTADDSVSATRVSENHFLIHHGNITDHIYFPTDERDDGTVSTDAECVLVREMPDGSARLSVILATRLTYRGLSRWGSPRAASGEVMIAR